MPNTLEENVNRVKAAKTAIGNAITAKGGTVGANDGLEDFASDIATIPSGGSVEFSNTPNAFHLMKNIRNLDVVIPEGCTSIYGSSYNNENAFSNCTGLNSVKIPSTVTSIGVSAFYNCGLKTIEIPTSVTTIGNNAFNLSALQKIYIDKPQGSISGSPWGATNANIIWRTERFTSAVNETSSDNSLTTSVSCNVGDLIVATFENLGGEYTLPSGWTLLGDSGAVVISQWTQRTGMAYKIAESTTESFTLTQASSGRMFTNLIAITGASIGTFSGFTKNETNNTITATKPQGLTIWAFSTLWWGSKWDVSPIDNKMKISNNRCENVLDQSDDTTVTFTTDTTQAAGGLAYASLTITGIDNFWYYDD